MSSFPREGHTITQTTNVKFASDATAAFKKFMDFIPKIIAHEPVVRTPRIKHLNTLIKFLNVHIREEISSIIISEH